jgi:predicted lipid-binding transport protein (Tim44 family)
MKSRFAILASMIMLSTGCSSITGTTGQSVSLQTRDKAGAEVPGAACELTNNKGKWFVTTPGSVQIRRSNDDMLVQCTKTGHETGQASVVSDTKGSMFGNIIFGGGIGAVVDHNTGAAYEYPTLIQVVMGLVTKVETPKTGTTGSGSIPADAAPSHSQPQTQPQVPAPTQVQAPATAQPQQVSAVEQAASAPTPAAYAQVTANNTRGTEARLLELKRMRDANLISPEIYLERQRSILDGR